MENQKIKVKENDAFVALSKSTGIPETHLNDRIIRRLLQNDYITPNTTETSIQKIADDLNTPIGCVASQLFFIDELNDEVVQLTGMIFISPVVFLSQIEVDKICENMGAIRTEMEWDFDEGTFEQEGMDMVSGGFYITFDLSVDEWGKITPSTHTEPEEYEMKERNIEIANLMVYKDEIECTLEEVQYIQIIKCMENSILTF